MTERERRSAAIKARARAQGIVVPVVRPLPLHTIDLEISTKTPARLRPVTLGEASVTAESVRSVTPGEVPSAPYISALVPRMTEGTRSDLPRGAEAQCPVCWRLSSRFFFAAPPGFSSRFFFGRAGLLPSMEGSQRGRLASDLDGNGAMVVPSPMRDPSHRTASLRPLQGCPGGNGAVWWCGSVTSVRRRGSP